MEKKQLLREAEIEPTAEIIAQGLGKANNAYIEFMEEVKLHDIEVDWRYYKDGKSWLGKGLYKWTTSRGTPKEVTAFWLSIWDGFFRIGLIIAEKYRGDVMCLPLSDDTKKMIENSKQMGKMKVFSIGFDLCSNDLLNDIYTLIDFKKKLK